MRLRIDRYREDATPLERRVEARCLRKLANHIDIYIRRGHFKGDTLQAALATLQHARLRAEELHPEEPADAPAHPAEAIQ